jgi:hypothetical protein
MVLVPPDAVLPGHEGSGRPISIEAHPRRGWGASTHTPRAATRHRMVTDGSDSAAPRPFAAPVLFGASQPRIEQTTQDHHWSKVAVAHLERRTRPVAPDPSRPARSEQRAAGVREQCQDRSDLR